MQDMSIPQIERSPILDANGVAKHFGAVIALKDASLRIHRGEIVALMGANGAGKSTLVKILTGALRRDGGDVRIDNHNSFLASPAAAKIAGLVPVYQDPSLIRDLNVTDNLRLGDTPREPFRHWVNELGVTDLKFDQMAGQLPLAILRILDLARALASKPHILLLDEMTAALPTNLVERVLRVVRSQADAGLSVIYVSHRLAEISQLCDRATVLRDGVTVGDLAIKKGIEEKIVELMLGAALTAIQTGTPSTLKTKSLTDVPKLRVRHLSATTKLSDVSFDLHGGEVLGVVALEGQGQDELFNVLAGFRRAAEGTLEVAGHAVKFHHPTDAIAAGLTLVPGDRTSALLMSRSVHENIALPLVARFRKWGIIPKNAELERVKGAIDRLQIDTRAQGEVRRLSGGNQQKVTIARWIVKGVDTLLLFDPTRGIDVRTKRQLYALIRELANQGAAVLYYTSELSEIKLACDRTLVIFAGRVVTVIEAGDADEPTLMRAAYGLIEDNKAEAIP
jgi:ribose transport system ATP-binding protein